MARKARTPAYGLHKATGQARVRIDGQDHYLGDHGSPESYRRYADLIDRWRLKQQAKMSPVMTLGQLALMYSEIAATYYRKGGKPTSEVTSIRAALKPLLKMFRSVELADFGQVKLRAYRQILIENDISRYTTNKYVGRVVRMVRWAVSEGYCDPSVLNALETVDGLKAGRTKARESKGVRPVDVDDVNAIEHHIGRELWGAIQFQLHTGCRPGEALIVRAVDVDMQGDVWTFTPSSHKTEHHGRRRQILIGPKGQQVVREYLTTDLNGYLFGVAGTDRPYRRDSPTRTEFDAPASGPVSTCGSRTS